MRNRAQHEADTGHTPAPGGKTGTERRQEIHHLADTLGISPLPAPEVGAIVKQAATAVGLAPVGTRAVWRAASGFTHGRY